MALLKDNPVVQRLVQSSEAQVSRVVQLVLANETFLSTVQSVVQTTLAAKGTFDKSVRGALGAMSLPTRSEVEALGDRLSTLEGAVAALQAQVEALSAPAKPKRRAAKRASS